MELLKHLQKREEQGKPIRSGLVGCGQMGSGYVHATKRVEGLRTAAIADVDPNRPLRTLKEMGIEKSSICVTSQAPQAEDAVRAGKVLVTDDALMLTKLDCLDVLIEATGSTEIGAKVAWHSIMNRKHVVMLNVETDVTVGPLLARTAKQTGCVYTVATGDEPGVLKQLHDAARIWGFEVVCLGKGKNNKIDRDATPDSSREDAEKKGMNPKMLSAFRDGTKTMIELAAVSNATGMVPDVPGCHGSKADLDELARVFVPKADGGILSRKGIVDFSTGKVAPGVFAIVTSDSPRILADMTDLYTMDAGPYYLLYRPFHLPSIEMTVAVAEAVVYGEATLSSERLVSELGAVAKRDLKAGEIIGDLGSADIYGLIYTYQQARQEQTVPLGLIPGAKVLRDIPKGAMLNEGNVAPDQQKFVYQLRKVQDSALAAEESKGD